MSDTPDNSPDPKSNARSSRDAFLYPTGTYRGEFTPERLAFNANLQEFAQRVSVICGLETNGKVTSEAAYHQIKALWQKLQESKENLLDAERPDEPELPEE